VIHKYKLSIDPDELLDKIFDALRDNTTASDISGKEIDGDETRHFKLGALVINRLSGELTIEAQDELTGEWLTIDVGQDIIAQVVT